MSASCPSSTVLSIVSAAGLALAGLPPTQDAAPAQDAAPGRALAAPGGATLVVLNKSEATISLVDPASGETRAKLPVGVGPHEAATAPDGRTVVVCNYGDFRAQGRTLTVVDVPAEEVVRTIDLGEYHRPHGIVFLDAERVLVTAEVERKLLVVHVGEGTVEAAVDTDQDASHMVALTPDKKLAFTANIGSGSVSVIDVAGRALLEVVPTGAGAEGICAHPTRPEVWVTNRAANTVSVVDTWTLEEVAELTCPEFPIRVVITPDGRHALVSCAQSGDVAVYDVAERREVKRIAMTETARDDASERLFGDRFGSSPVPIGVLVRPDGAEAYVANTNADILTVLDLEALTVDRRIGTGKQPDGLAWVPAPRAAEAEPGAGGAQEGDGASEAGGG